MTEQAKEALNALLTQLIDMAQKGVDMAQAEIPIILQQLILRDRILHSIGMLVVMAAHIILIYGLRRGLKTRFFEPGSAGGPEAPFIISAIGAVGTVVSLMVFYPMGGLSRLITVWVAPKLYLIEYLSKMLDN